jgi:hypothetical protein
LRNCGLIYEASGFDAQPNFFNVFFQIHPILFPIGGAGIARIIRPSFSSKPIHSSYQPSNH